MRSNNSIPSLGIVGRLFPIGSEILKPLINPDDLKNFERLVMMKDKPSFAKSHFRAPRQKFLQTPLNSRYS